MAVHRRAGQTVGLKAGTQVTRYGATSGELDDCSDGLEPMYQVAKAPRAATAAKTQPFGTKMNETAMNAHIVVIAMTFVRGLIDRCRSQSLRVGPKRRWLSSQFSRRELPLLKQKSASIMNTVVGSPGTKIPTNPTPTSTTPATV